MQSIRSSIDNVIFQVQSPSLLEMCIIDLHENDPRVVGIFQNLLKFMIERVENPSDGEELLTPETAEFLNFPIENFKNAPAQRTHASPDSLLIRDEVSTAMLKDNIESLFESYRKHKDAKYFYNNSDRTPYWACFRTRLDLRAATDGWPDVFGQHKCLISASGRTNINADYNPRTCIYMLVKNKRPQLPVKLYASNVYDKTGESDWMRASLFDDQAVRYEINQPFFMPLDSAQYLSFVPEQLRMYPEYESRMWDNGISPGLTYGRNAGKEEWPMKYAVRWPRHLNIPEISELQFEEGFYLHRSHVDLSKDLITLSNAVGTVRTGFGVARLLANYLGRDRN